jgi:3',5'-cyclic AMP phosphodiesterase CpdA
MFTLRQQPGSVNLTGTYYSFDQGDAHFAVLNTNDMYPMSMQQRNWLKNDMSASGAKWKILLMHRAAFSAGKNINKPDTVIMRNVLLPIIEELGVDLVLSGHDHMYYRSEPVKNGKAVGAAAHAALARGDAYTDANGPVHIVPGTAGPKKYNPIAIPMPPIAEVAVKNLQPGLPVFGTVKIDGGTLTWRAYTYDSTAGESALLDELTLEKTKFRAPAGSMLPTDYVSTFPAYVKSVFVELARMLGDYLFKLLPAALRAAGG